MNGKDTVVKKLAHQLTNVANEEAFPLASDPKSSLVIIHGIAPGPMLKKMTYSTENPTVKKFK